MHLLAEMRLDGVAPNEVIFGGLISACRKGGQPQRARDLLFRMLELRLRPNVQVFNVVIAGLCEGDAPDPEAARAVLAALEQKRTLRPTPGTFGPIAEAFAVQGDWRSALEVLQAMTARGIRPRVETFTAVVQACEKGRQWGKALQVRACVYTAVSALCLFCARRSG